MSTGHLDELAFDGPARIHWVGSDQLASHALVVPRVSLDTLVWAEDEFGHNAEHSVASIRQVFLDLKGICRKCRRDPLHDLGQGRRIGMGLECADHPIEDLLHRFAPHSLTTVRRPDVNCEGEWRLGASGRVHHLKVDTFADER